MDPPKSAWLSMNRLFCFTVGLFVLSKRPFDKKLQVARVEYLSYVHVR